MTADPGQFDLIRAALARGDWPSLAEWRLPDATPAPQEARPDMLAALLQDAPDRARLALALAVAQARHGAQDKARHLLGLAIGWGCPRDRAAAALSSGALDALAEAALLAQDEGGAGQLTRRAAALLADGATPADADRLAAEALRRARARLPHPATGRHAASAPHLARLAEALPGWQAGRDMPLLLETKSLPRSGLHFLESRLSRVFGPGFRFCEWYQEPGCCRAFPCRLTPLPQEQGAGRTGLRMVKSHDFDLTDPTYAPGPGIHRLIMLRDPLMILTSWWALEELGRHGDILKAHDVPMTQIYFRHDPALLARAYRVIEARFRPVPPGALEAWLDRRSRFVLDFARKWCVPAPQTDIVGYDGLPGWLSGFLRARSGGVGGLGAEAETAITAIEAEAARDFRPRADPFRSRIRQVSDTLSDRRDLFLAACDRLRDTDDTGVLTPFWSQAHGGGAA